MPGAFDHLLVLALAVLFPIWAGTFGYRRLELAPPDDVPRVRRRLYLQALVLQWGLAAFVALLWLAHGRSWMDLGLRPRGGAPIWVGAGALVVALAFLIQARRAAANPRALDAVLPRLQHLERMLPHTRPELRAFCALSVTAGICEELLYRGYLLWYFGHWMPLVPALGLASLLFGIGHSYQGWRGIALTGLVGVVLAVVYLGAGVLYPAMLLHAAGDIHSGILAQAALSRRDERERAATSGD